jgi:class 3 adenylate cyclase
MTDRLTVDELAIALGIPAERVADLADRGVIERDTDGRFDPGDVHRLRLLQGFADAGIPLEALEAADRAGTISLRYYDQLHAPPGELSERPYAEFAASLGQAGDLLPRLFSAFGLAEPLAGARLAIGDEELLAELVAIVEAIGQPDLTLRAIRIFGEGARRAADGALGVYGEAVARSAESVAGLPIDDVFQSVLWPWARFARTAAPFAGWLMARHMSRAIDAYSIAATEGILEAGGFVPARTGPMPAVAFVDLTAFTRLTESIGDEAAAAIALRLGDLAAERVLPHDGRVVKLLGDGVLLRFADAARAIAGTIDLLLALPAADLPTAHAGIATGTLIDRDNDVFGRTVNLAARISDAAPDGRVYLPAASAAEVPEGSRWAFEPVERATLQGIGAVDLVEVRPSR